MRTTDRAVVIQGDLFKTVHSIYSSRRTLRFYFMLVLALSTPLSITACSSDDDDSEGGVIGTGVNVLSIAIGGNSTNSQGAAHDGRIDAGGPTGVTLQLQMIEHRISSDNK